MTSNVAVPLVFAIFTVSPKKYEVGETLKRASEVVLDTETFCAEIVVFEPEQIHILGSKQDIEGFKEFVEGKPAKEIEKPEEEIKEEFTDVDPLNPCN